MIEWINPPSASAYDVPFTFSTSYPFPSSHACSVLGVSVCDVQSSWNRHVKREKPIGPPAAALIARLGVFC